MTVRVLLFASYADAIGQHELSIDLPAGSRVSDVVMRVRTMASGHVLPPEPLLAVNAVYATPETQLEGNEDVAIIPPVAGG